MSCCLTLFELSVASVAKVLATPQPRDRKSQNNILQRRLLKSIPLLEHKLVLEIFSSLLKEKALSQRVLRYLTTCGPSTGDNERPWFHSLNLCTPKGSHISNNALILISAIGTLETLNLRRCTGFDDTGFSALQGLSNLKNLDLGGCSGLTDDGLLSLTSFNLVSISLDDVRISDVGCRVFKGMTQLQNLDLTRTQITDRTIHCLTKPLRKEKAQSLRSLTNLVLCGNDITKQNLHMLAENIDLRGTAVDAEDVKGLQDLFRRQKNVKNASIKLCHKLAIDYKDKNKRKQPQGSASPSFSTPLEEELMRAFGVYVSTPSNIKRDLHLDSDLCASFQPPIDEKENIENGASHLRTPEHKRRRRSMLPGGGSKYLSTPTSSTTATTTTTNNNLLTTPTRGQLSPASTPSSSWATIDSVLRNATLSSTRATSPYRSPSPFRCVVNKHRNVADRLRRKEEEDKQEREKNKKRKEFEVGDDEEEEEDDVIGAGKSKAKKKRFEEVIEEKKEDTKKKTNQKAKAKPSASVFDLSSDEELDDEEDENEKEKEEREAEQKSCQIEIRLEEPDRIEKESGEGKIHEESDDDVVVLMDVGLRTPERSRGEEKKVSEREERVGMEVDEEEREDGVSFHLSPEASPVISRTVVVEELPATTPTTPTTSTPIVCLFDFFSPPSSPYSTPMVRVPQYLGRRGGGLQQPQRRQQALQHQQQQQFRKKIAGGRVVVQPSRRYQGDDEETKKDGQQQQCDGNELDPLLFD